MRRLGAFAVAALAAAQMFTAVKAQNRPETLLRAAIEQETVKGDLRGAIAAYKAVADSTASTRPIRAEALVRIGGCYRKLGDARAKDVFERVIREFSDQMPSVAQASAALRELGVSSSNAELTIRRRSVIPAAVNAISDSGLLVAGQDSKTGDVLVWNLATGKSFRVDQGKRGSAGELSEFGDEPIFSPDATQVAYTWCETVKPASAARQMACDGNLRLSLVGDNGVESTRTLYRAAWTTPYAWSRDGSRIAAVANVDRDSDDLLLISTSDGEAIKLDRFSSKDVYLRAAFSADGKFLALDRMTSNDFDVFVYEISSARRIPIATTRANERLVGWNRDSTGILFISDAKGTNDLYEVRFSDGAIKSNATVLQSDLGDAIPLGLSSTGTLYYSIQTGREPTIHLGTLDFATGALKVQDGESADVVHGSAPTWTSDGTLAYLSSSSMRGGARTATLKAKSNGITREIVSDVSFRGAIAATPDPDVLLIEGTDSKGESGLYRVRLSTGAVTLLAQGARASFVGKDGRHVYFFRGKSPDHELVDRDLSTGSERTLIRYQHPGGIPESAFVSPDGTRVYYRLPEPDAKTPEPHSRVIEHDVASGRERQVFTGNLGHPWQSPDGRYLAIRDDDPFRKWIAMRLVSLTDSRPTRDLMRIEAGDGLFFSGWSPDSRSVLLRNTQNGRTTWWVPVNGGTAKQLTQYVPDPAIHPDGRTIAFSVNGTTPLQSEVWSMERFLKVP